MAIRHNYKHRLLSILFVGIVILFVLLFVQSFGGKYSDNVAYCWIWYYALYLPPLFILLQSNNDILMFRT